MTQVAVRRPFGKVKLSNHLRFKPDAVLHLFPRQRPWVRFFSGRLANGQASIPRCFSFAHTSRLSRGTKPFAYLTDKDELVAFVVADDQRVQRVVWGVAANNKCLRLVNLELELCTAALARLVTGIFALGEDALKSKFLHERD
jgi:hypothetical protein